jgi:hypothetical protein
MIPVWQGSKQAVCNRYSIGNLHFSILSGSRSGVFIGENVKCKEAPDAEMQRLPDRAISPAW